MKRTPEQKAKRRADRSAFLSRLVDEFKKVALIALFFVGVGFLVWTFILYSKGIEPTVSPTIPAALITALFGSYFAYCMAASKDKDSLNKNGLTKSNDGTISKIVTPIVEAAKNIFNSKDDSGTAAG